MDVSTGTSWASDQSPVPPTSSPSPPSGVTDALFYKGHLGKGKRKGDDKHTGGSFLAPLYDKNNPRTLVIIEPCESIQIKEPK